MKIHGKSYSFLIEMLLVILFFSICSVITLQFFVKAYEKSESSKEQNKALMYVQSQVEYLKSLEKNELIGLDDSEAVKYFDKDFQPIKVQDQKGYTLTTTIEKEEKQAGDMIKGSVSIYKLEKNNDSVDKKIKKNEINALDILMYFSK